MKATANSTVVSTEPALKITLAASSLTPLLAQTVAFTTNASGGSGGPYTYRYVGFPPGCVSENKSSVGCLPTQADWYNVTAIVSDHNNGSANATVSIHVVFDFNVVVPASSAVGQQLTIYVNTNQSFPTSNSTNKTAAAAPAGGYGAMTYNYDGLPPGCTSVDAARLTCYPSQTGTYRVTVGVHDEAGDRNTHTVSVTIVPGFLGLPGNDGYYLLGGIGGVAALALAVMVSRRRRHGTPKKRENDATEEPSVSSPSPPSQGEAPVTDAPGAMTPHGAPDQGSMAQLEPTATSSDSLAAGASTQSTIRTSVTSSRPAAQTENGVTGVTKVCIMCGKRIPSKARFCPHCEESQG